MEKALKKIRICALVAEFLMAVPLASIADGNAANSGKSVDGLLNSSSRGHDNSFGSGRNAESKGSVFIPGFEVPPALIAFIGIALILKRKVIE